jgi:hypothetical protein
MRAERIRWKARIEKQDWVEKTARARFRKYKIGTKSTAVIQPGSAVILQPPTFRPSG